MVPFGNGSFKLLRDLTMPALRHDLFTSTTNTSAADLSCSNIDECANETCGANAFCHDLPEREGTAPWPPFRACPSARCLGARRPCGANREERKRRGFSRDVDSGLIGEPRHTEDHAQHRRAVGRDGQACVVVVERRTDSRQPPEGDRAGVGVERRPVPPV